MAEVVLGLGANLGDPVAQLRRAVAGLAPLFDGLACSSLYRTAPVGFRDQPDFYNLVCAGPTTLSPAALLREIQSLERGLGRVRTFRNAPRTLDIDILDHDGRTESLPGLTLPHPRMHDRAFVLIPLAELLPGWRHPVLGGTAAELLAALRSPPAVERSGRLEERG